MTDPDRDLPAPPRVDTFAFHDDSLVAVLLEDREVALPVRSVCGALGLDAERQSARLREHDVLSQGLRVVKIPVGGRVQSVLAINRRYLAFWLATISPHQVNEESRPKLILYQSELVDLLDTLYGSGTLPEAAGGDSAIRDLRERLTAMLAELRATRTALAGALGETSARVAAQDARLDAQDARLTTVEGLINDQLTTVQGQLAETQQRLLDQTKITAAQQAVIQLAIKRISKRYEARHGKKLYDVLFSRFVHELNAPRYDALPAAKYGQALDWLRARAAEYLPGDPDALPALQESLL